MVMLRLLVQINRYYRVFLSGLVYAIMLAMPVLAAELPLPDNSRQLEQSSVQTGNFRIALGKPRKVDGRWQFEKEWQLNGKRQTTLYLLDNRADYRETVAYFSQWVSASSAEILFACAGRDCGASNVWANDFFEDRRLYGPDDKQYYWVLRQGSDYRVLYLIERGNRQVHLLIQHVQVQAQLTRPDTVMLDEHCHHAQLERWLAEVASGHWLLLASVPADQQQTVSIRLGTQCKQKLLRQWPQLSIRVLGLGEYDRHWKRPAHIQFELLPQQ